MKNENPKKLEATVISGIKFFCTGITCPKYLCSKPLDFIFNYNNSYKQKINEKSVAYALLSEA